MNQNKRRGRLMCILTASHANARPIKPRNHITFSANAIPRSNCEHIKWATEHRLLSNRKIMLPCKVSMQSNQGLCVHPWRKIQEQEWSKTNKNIFAIIKIWIFIIIGRNAIEMQVSFTTMRKSPLHERINGNIICLMLSFFLAYLSGTLYVCDFTDIPVRYFCSRQTQVFL